MTQKMSTKYLEFGAEKSMVQSLKKGLALEYIFCFVCPDTPRDRVALSSIKVDIYNLWTHSSINTSL